MISAIILKLLLKNAEDRYQSAAGLQADLEKSLQRLKPDNIIEEFPVGAADYTSRFRFPQKLYGRDSELQELVRVFEGACRETAEIILVSGFSGIGKTALVEDIQRPVSENRGYFIKGKFDQYLKTTPYTAITQAFAVFVSRILAEPEHNFNEWQAKIQSAVGDLGRVLTDVIPALDDLIGAQPEVPQLGGQEAENRFNYVFINFLLTVAIESHPLVLFVDDLQWIDAASLRLLKVIQSDFRQPGLLVIGAFRDNEVDASHPLMGFIGDQEKVGKPPRILKLENLQPQHLETFLADTLRSQKGIHELGSVIYEKTQGNPFFSRRLLASLYEEGRIRHDSASNSWKWDMRDIGAASIADNVANLLARKMIQLPEESQNILKLAACIGNRFDLATLTMISGLVEKEVRKTLSVSLSGQYVLGSDDTYEFVHDQVQQGGYALIAAEDRPRVHLEIGRLSLSKTASENVEQDIFNIAHHFNVGSALLTSESERIQVAELNLKSAQKAKRAAAYAEGLHYTERGLALLEPDSWQNDYDLTLALHDEAAELAYLTGHYDKLEDIEGRIHKNARSILDRARIYYIRIQADISQANYLEAIEIGIRVLEGLGIKIPREPTPEDHQRFQAAFSEALCGRSIEELIYLPAMTDRTALAAMEILAAEVHTAFVAAPQLLLPIVYQGATLSLQNGNGPWSPFFHCGVGAMLCAVVDAAPSDEATAAVKISNQLQKVAFALLDNPNNARSKAKTLSGAGGHIQIWNEPFIHALDTMLLAYEAGLETGDLVFAALGIYHYANLGLAAGMNLGEYQRKVTGYNQRVKAIGQEVNYRRISIGLQTAHNFMTPGSTPHVLKGRHFDEDRWLPDAVATQDRSNLNYLFLKKLWLSYHFDCDDRLIEYAGEAEKYLDGVTAMINTALFRLYDSLSRLRLYDGFSENERQETLQRVAGNQLRMRIWSENTPMNYKHKYDLVTAETARVSGNIGAAIENYEQAIKGAGDNGFIHEEALANDLYARFRQQRGNDRLAEMYMQEARILYYQWGASAKVSHLSKRYPQWFKTQTMSGTQPDTPGSAGSVHTTLTVPITSIKMDLDSIVSVSRTLSAETDLEQLLTKMMDFVMTNSGAEKGVLLLRQENDWFVQARSNVTTAEHEILCNRPNDPADSDNEGVMVPERVFEYCRRSKTVLVVADANKDQRFAADRLIQKYGIQSIACIPALHQGKLRALLYLENRQIPDVFTQERLEILQHLSSQFGVSVENVLLFDSLNRKVRELRQSEERYELAVTGSAAGIWDWDLASDKVFYSDRLKELLGYATDELLDTLDEFWNRLHPDDYEPARLAVDQHLKQGVPYICDYRLQTKSGEYRWFHARGQAFWDKTGKATRMSGSLIDITARKQAENELRGAYTEIKQLKNQLEAESAYLQDEIKLEHNFENIIGQSEALKYVLNRVEQVAPLDSPVLIMGETGTGKELMARALHKLSPHGKRAMVKVNCAALPGELIESELFGREKGAFTGATTTQLGRFEVAKGSTLFLDEIGELPLELQAKLLRVLESGEFEKLGSARTLHSDARIIAATNRVLEKEVRKGRFREDLWYRLKVFQ
ncbi:MAG: sigma 54-interacting transcriptional regulator, partial [Deltaproteobacteria bacterium]|nr:sigma 54-interacting transcriptional regulator [Deltaproteobacteria bacterium]